MIKDIQKVQSALENRYMSETRTIDSVAVALYKKSPKKAIKYITEYSDRSGANTFAEWKKLYAYLFTKYMDGNIKEPVPGQMNPSVKQPGYSNEFYRMIVNSAGDRLKVNPNPIK